MHPIGYVRTDHKGEMPRHFSVSQVKGTLEIDKKYEKGLEDLKVGQDIAVIFYFHKSKEFSLENIRQVPRTKNYKKGVFSICSPRRPNPVGMSVVTILDIKENLVFVQSIDMFDGTPILDIKPFWGLNKK